MTQLETEYYKDITKILQTAVCMYSTESMTLFVFISLNRVSGLTAQVTHNRLWTVEVLYYPTHCHTRVSSGFKTVNLVLVYLIQDSKYS